MSKNTVIAFQKIGRELRPITDGAGNMKKFHQFNDRKELEKINGLKLIYPECLTDGNEVGDKTLPIPKSLLPHFYGRKYYKTKQEKFIFEEED